MKEIEKVLGHHYMYNSNLTLVHVLAAARRVIWLNLRGSTAVSSRNLSPWRAADLLLVKLQAPERVTA